MDVEIARVAYAYNSALAQNGQPAYFLDCYVAKRGTTVVDRHESFHSREAFLDAIGEVIPVIDPPAELEASDGQED